MANYNTANSLSPMIFKKSSNKDKEGTRSERWRSKSMEHIYDGPAIPAHLKQRSRGATAATVMPLCHWKEIDKLKSLAPTVACVLPSVAMDFVASSLLAVGAIPVICEDPADMPVELSNCKAVVVDISAPQEMIEAFLDNNGDSMNKSTPVVLVASNCGVNNRKKELLLSILDEHDVHVSMISGRLGDVYALGQAAVEKTSSPLDSLSDMSDFSDEEMNIPKVVLNKQLPRKEPPLSPIMKKIRRKKGGSPPKSMSNGGTPSPSFSPGASPRTSPRTSPVPVVRGVKKYLKKKEAGMKDDGMKKMTSTALPICNMKGQFRETQMGNVKVDEGLEYAQKLSAYSTAMVHIYETNVVTSGELVVEITNTQQGMGNLHSTLPCSAAIVAATLACADNSHHDNDKCVEQCSHALALYYVAAEEAGGLASSKGEKGLISPGTLRQQFLDQLHGLTEEEVRAKALLSIHSEGLKSPQH